MRKNRTAEPVAAWEVIGIQIKFPFHYERKDETKRLILDAGVFPICWTKIEQVKSGFVLCQRHCIVLVHNDGVNMRIVTLNPGESDE